MCHPLIKDLRTLVLLPGLWFLSGCSDEEYSTKQSTVAPQAALATAASGAAEGYKAAAAPGETARDADLPKAEPVSRKIIYNAQVSLVVDSVPRVGEKIRELLRASGGYLSQTNQTSDTNQQRRASWTVRVPVERFDNFLKAIERLGELQQTQLDSQDVTQEYYDIEARIKNKQEEEKRLVKHLSDSTGKLEDILAVERELSRVRGEIEQMQGRIRYLANMTSLSTITISAIETRDYVPPVRPTFAAQIRRTFESSLKNLVHFAEAIILAAVALGPWLLLAAVVATPPILLFWIRRRARHSSRTRSG